MRSAEQIKARVTEITPLEIKYKRFDNLNGSTITAAKADVFAITYENGMREIINPFAVADDVVKIRGLYMPDALGIEISGGGGGGYIFDLGIRYTRHFSPHFGVDIIKFNARSSFRNFSYYRGYMEMFSFQMLTGFRFVSEHFGAKNNSSIYTAFRFGVGYYSRIFYEGKPPVYDDLNYIGSWHTDYYRGSDKGLEFCMEWDVVTVQWKRYSMGAYLSYDVSRSYFAKSDDYFTGPKLEDYFFFGLRLGVDIGRINSNNLNLTR